MGYTSDIRFLVPLADYTKMKGDCQAKYGDGSLFISLNKEEIRKDGDGKEFMYFGWNCIKWYTNLNDGDYREIDDIEEAVYGCGQYHKVRIGEDCSDIEEDFDLGNSSVDCIEITRGFDEGRDENYIFYVVMIRDFGGIGCPVINECAVFTADYKARAHFKAVIEKYKTGGLKEYLDNGNAGFSEDTDKDYVMVETENNFSFYKQGYYNDNHLEIWISEKETNCGGNAL